MCLSFQFAAVAVSVLAVAFGGVIPSYHHGFDLHGHHDYGHSSDLYYGGHISHGHDHKVIVPVVKEVSVVKKVPIVKHVSVVKHVAVVKHVPVVSHVPVVKHVDVVKKVPVVSHVTLDLGHHYDDHGLDLHGHHDYHSHNLLSHHY